ncbi:MAG: adenylate/guanylate cyclase domain-containing protein [Bdellovibrionales bacterium]|nr:adenylate/guanylate cyclase domain-containing protein [Bdellovibrionales bacterium]
MGLEPLQRRAAIYYLFSIGMLSVYGGEVCPFLEGVGFLHVAAILSSYLLGCLIVRHYVLKRFVVSVPPLDRAINQFFVELGIFLLWGLLVTIHNAVLYDFPVASGIKLCLGCLTLGFFLALDLSIVREYQLLLSAIERKQEIVLEGKFLRLTTKFIVLSLSSVLLIGTVMSLMLLHDLSWISTQPADYMPQAKRLVLFEMFLVGGVLICLLMNLIFSYSRNLRLFFDMEQQVLDQVAQGNLNGMVPVGSRDELGLIAKHTNSMIRGLRQMTQAKETFGKFVSAEVAERILDDPERALELGGTRRNLTILISDIRNFTDRVERNRAEDVVSELNLYFTEMVKIVHRHQGVVDKFIGDGLLAVFGLDDPEAASRCAVAAGVAMLNAVEKLNAQLSSPIEIGIGISRGDVVVGNIGSAERLEFTAIGDAVNVAARLEASAKELCCPLVVSDEVYLELSQRQKQLSWKLFGGQRLKGKTTEVTVHGLREVPPGPLQSGSAR